MARKKIGKILSGGAIVFCVVLLCTMSNNVQAQWTAQRVTFTISGSAGTSGVTMKGLPGNVVTDASGFYSATVDYNWKGTVTPVLDGYTFSPASKTYPGVTGNLTNENYVPTPITYTITGKVNMEGVEMNGLPGNPVTGSDGSYSATVAYGWQGTVTPIKEGFDFTPSNRGYPPVKSNQTGQDYTPAPKMLLIAGSAGVEGAVLDGLPGNPKTGPNGNYSVKVKYGWSGTVTPKKEGYEFSPAYTDYPNVIDTQSNQDYVATALTYVISGTAGMDGVEMKGLPGNPVTDLNGFYSVTVNYGFSATVEPTKPGYTFTPASKIYTKVNSDRKDENYSAAVVKLTISGTTRLEGVTMNGLPGNPVTGKDGSYSVTVDYNWTGTVTPAKEGYTFKPENKTYPAVTRSMANENYVAALMTFTISGNVGVPGVMMKGFPGKAIVSGPGGAYSGTVEYRWKGTVTPTKEGYEFQPANMPYDNVMMDQTNENYQATLQKMTISGRITSNKGKPVPDIYILAQPDSSPVTTDANGEYKLQVDYGWRGKITPTKEGYTFSPPSRLFSIITRDVPNQLFTGTVQMFTISGDVIIGGVPIEGVTIAANNGGGTATTNARGKFSIEVPYGWAGEITPTKPGLTFNPPSMPFTSVTTDLIIKDGVAQPVRPPAAAAPPPATAGPPIPTPTPTAPSTVVPQPSTPGPGIPQPTVPAPSTIPTPTPEPNVVVPGATQPIPRPPTKPKATTEDEIKRILQQMLAKQQGGAAAVPQVPGPAAQVSTSGEPLITNTFVDSDIVLDVLPAIAQQAGISIIPDETVTGLISADLKGVPLDTALQIVLAGTPYVVKKTPYYYLVCSGGVTDSKFPVVSETKRLTMNYITAQAAVGLLSPAFKNYVQAEAPMPGTNTSTYTVVVTAPPALTARIIEDLRKIDKIPPQVLLEARIVVMERTDLLNLGVEWSWPSMRAGVFGGNNYGLGDAAHDFAGKWPWGVQMGYSPDNTFTNALELTLNLLAENGEATVLAKPQVLAENDKEAQIGVTTEENFALFSPQVNPYNYTYTEFTKIESGTTLKITPHVGDNNDITLLVAVEVSESQAKGTGSDLPVVTRRTAKNSVTVKDGGTVALAGLTENRTRTNNKHVPGLSKLPLIGDLFKNQNNDNSSREIAVFVTARIVRQNQRTMRFPEPTGAKQAPIPPAQAGGFRSELRQGMGQGMDQGMGQGMEQPQNQEDFRQSLRDRLSRQLR
jgi:Bacterial type II and III secretion system protein